MKMCIGITFLVGNEEIFVQIYQGFVTNALDVHSCDEGGLSLQRIQYWQGSLPTVGKK